MSGTPRSRFPSVLHSSCPELRRVIHKGAYDFLICSEWELVLTSTGVSLRGEIEGLLKEEFLGTGLEPAAGNLCILAC